jgi:predicted TIM-barrel fold metal-dependent hydrolase
MNTKPERIVDAHMHVFFHGKDDAGLVQDMDAHGISSAWLLSWDMSAAEDDGFYHPVLNPMHMRQDGTHEGLVLSDIMLACRRFPDRFVPGYCPHPARRDASSLLRAAREIHGARVCGEWKFKMLFDDPRCLELFRTAGALGMPVVLHLDVPYLPPRGTKRKYQPGWYGGTVENLERALAECPDTLFIGHAPGFWRELSGDADESPESNPSGPVVPGGRIARLFDTHENLHADLSANSGLNALRRDAGHARDFLTRWADRLLFGRDIYGGSLLEFLLGLNLPLETLEKICHKNADRLIKP